MSVQAVAKGVRISPRKTNEVASLVRGRTVADAIVILDHTPRRAALAVKKAVESAKANATYNHRYRADSLVIKEISVTAGPSLKRFRPIAHGRANPFQRQSSHIRVIVDGELKPEKKSKTKSAESSAKKTESKGEDK
jgi:large subunit ribosomal protein L22